MRKIDEYWKDEHKHFVQIEEIEAVVESFPSIFLYKLYDMETNTTKHINKYNGIIYEITNKEYQEQLHNLENWEALLLNKNIDTGEQTFWK